MSKREFPVGVIVGACAVGILWASADAPRSAEIPFGSPEEVSPDSDGRAGMGRTRLAEGLEFEARREFLGAESDRVALGDPCSFTEPGDEPPASRTDSVIRWDPVEAYEALRRDPVPSPYPWERVARGLEEVGRSGMAAEAWWTVLRLNPTHALALASLEALEPGAVDSRMELELQRHSNFPERAEMEAYLVPRWIQSGRLAAARECIDVDRLLKTLRDKRYPRTSARPDQVHRLHLLMELRPREAELAFEDLLGREGIWGEDKEVLKALLVELRGGGEGMEPEQEPIESWTDEEREELLADGHFDLIDLESLLRARPESIERVEDLVEDLLVDAGRDPEERARQLTELAELYLARGDRSRARELLLAATGIYPSSNAWELRRQLELGRK